MSTKYCLYLVSHKIWDLSSTFSITVEHAVNVAVAVYRFLSKMATESTVDVIVLDRKLKITDPLTKFSCIFAALIHDAGNLIAMVFGLY
jgi:hypothetical protein